MFIKTVQNRTKIEELIFYLKKSFSLMLKSRYKIKQIFLEPVYLCLCTGAYKLYTQTEKLPHPSVQYSTVLRTLYPKTEATF